MEKSERSIDNIKKIMKRLNVFFDKSKNYDESAIIELERNLIKTECKLGIFSNYRQKNLEDS